MVYPHVFRTEHSETRTTNGEYGEFFAKTLETKMKIQPSLLKILQYTDSNREKFVEDLREFLTIKSISGTLENLDDANQMVKFVEKWMKKLGVKYECFDIGTTEIEGKKVSITPVIIGRLGTSPNKQTLLIYAYLDVKNPDMEKWETDPWDAVLKNQKLYGNGVAGGKGPLVCWFHVIKAFQDKGTELPVNIQFLVESMHYKNSQNLEDFITNNRQRLFPDISSTIVNDCEWMGVKYPCIFYGCIGILHFMLTVTKKENSTADPKEDMNKIFKEMVDEEGNILIPNFADFVQQITPDEENIYEHMPRANLPPYQQKWDKVQMLMHFWRLPSIFLDEILECNCDKQDFSTIKRHFVIKIVPRQVDYKTAELVQNFVKDTRKKLKIESKMECELISSSRPWVESVSSPQYIAAARATIQIYKMKPSLIREDRNIPIVSMLSKVMEKPVMLLPLPSMGANISEPNENISLKNYYEGTKLLAAYILQIAEMKNVK
ncbi:cytosolic non-specific dipeptidase-like [Agrilus planipennis]|uniref:Cytosolic non-specific dipeptidase-like n=1 Tax=Agrilus planipennis TaxID=224129 RepID=A0A7F5RIL9_AGRPL|nr:cytosolic non-specific dipeptidase-like [Agrilus planipennis]